jgi:hypothetical protein
LTVQSFSRNATPEIDIEELETLMLSGDVRVLDVREDWEYRRGRVPGALHIPLGRLPASTADLPRDKPILVICESGSRSLAAADFYFGTASRERCRFAAGPVPGHAACARRRGTERD